MKKVFVKALVLLLHDGNMYNLTSQCRPSGFDKVGFQLSPILAQPD